MIDTSAGVQISNELVHNYFESLVNAFFKILPIKESGEPSLEVYIESLRNELLGAQSLIIELDNNPGFLTLIATLQYLYDNPNCSVKDVKREVFRAISICKKIADRYEKEEA